MKVELPQYNGKDNLVMLYILIPDALIINSLFFGAAYFSNWPFFGYTTLVTMLSLALYFILCGVVAVLYKNRFPREDELAKRLSFMIITFLLMTGLFLYFMFRGYEAVGFFNIRFSESGFIWSYFALGITNIFITFLMEGIARYHDWQANLIETEKINAAYKQSQLNGLKSQINPHFLFNCLNSLSSLIQEDETKAEDFLNEMSKVYRYMLRTDEEQLVTLDTELKFLSSYHHLLKTRYGDGLLLNINVKPGDLDKLIAPLSLQVIVENTFSQNVVSKHAPLFIEVATADGGLIYVKNNKQPKVVTDNADAAASLDNLLKKYELLGKPVAVNDNVTGLRVIFIPLLNNKEEVDV